VRAYFTAPAEVSLPRRAPCAASSPLAATCVSAPAGMPPSCSSTPTSVSAPLTWPAPASWISSSRACMADAAEEGANCHRLDRTVSVDSRTTSPSNMQIMRKGKQASCNWRNWARSRKNEVRFEAKVRGEAFIPEPLRPHQVNRQKTVFRRTELTVIQILIISQMRKNRDVSSLLSEQEWLFFTMILCHRHCGTARTPRISLIPATLLLPPSPYLDG
jgi:hypothetical protein